MARAERGYRPLRDYALLGDCHGAALVACDGGIDWCCIGRMDADPVFCRILDRERGGFLAVTLEGETKSSREYLRDTNVVRTQLRSSSAALLLTDFMPVGRAPGSGVHDYVTLRAPLCLVRQIEAVGGPATFTVTFRPSVNFARDAATLTASGDCVRTQGGAVLLHDGAAFTIHGDMAQATVTLAEGETLNLVIAEGEAAARQTLRACDSLRDVTMAFWREWIGYCRYRGPHEEQVRRSLLTIKALIYAPTGAIAAAATTSLPEEIGGERNWDYRYCWLRDSTFALYALSLAGYGGEARRFADYLIACSAKTAPDLRIMYGLGGETELTEKILDHLDGYEGSKPVRTGNGAYLQKQMDVYGEILDWAFLYQTLGGHFDDKARAVMSTLADYAAEHWNEPDQGLWEMRGPPMHHVHGKVMSWVALDRALHVCGIDEKWRRARDAIVLDVTANGLAPAGHLQQAYGQSGMDAALLLIPMTAYPLDIEILRATVAAIETELREGDFVFRYRAEDGLSGGEGAFLICSFWLVDALLHLGRTEEARALFNRLCAKSNDVGIFAEEIDPADGKFLGNLPQAYTHLALIGSAVHLQLCADKGPEALRGSYADRARRTVSATLGWRALWAVFRQTWKIGRLRSSAASMLDLDEKVRASP